MSGLVSVDMARAVRALVGDPAAGWWDDQQIYDFLSEAQRQLADRLPDSAVPELSTIQGRALSPPTASYDLPDDLLRIRLIVYKGKAARQWPLHELGTLSQAGASEDAPVFYVWGSQVVFPFVVTAGSFYIWYTRRPPDIGGNADPVLGAGHRPVMESFAVSRCWQNIRHETEASWWMEWFKSQCAAVASRYGDTPPDDGPAGDPRV